MIQDENMCVECGSRFIREKSKMENLCPECSHYLYGYSKCSHVFKNGECMYCHWNGNESEYIKNLKEDK